METTPKKKTPEELHKELEKIYTDGEGQLPDFTRLDGQPGSRFKSLLVGALVFFILLAGVTWAGFFLFLKPSGFTGDGVDVIVSTAPPLASGGETEVTVAYENREKVPLASGRIDVELPDGFIRTSADPEPGPEGDWSIGSIPAGGKGAITFKGWVRQPVGATLTFQATLTYKPADFNSPFQKVSSHTAGVDGSVLTLSASTTEEMTPGDSIDLTYAYENTSDRTLENMRFLIDPPAGFIFEKAEPAPDAGYDDRWSIAKIEPKAKGKIVIHGTYSTSARGPQGLKARIGFVADEALVPAAEAVAITDVKKSDLAMELIVNGAAKAPAVSFGDTLHFSLVYKNTGDVSLRDVVLSVQLPSEPAGVDLVDWVTLKDDLVGTRKGAVVTWTKKEIPGLEEIKAEAEGTIDFSVQLVKKPAAEGTATRYAVNAQAIGEIGKAGKTTINRVVAGTPLAIVLNSDTSFRAYGRYFDESGAPVGSGPLPPKAGEKTVYRVYWVIQNSLHELSNLGVSTVLPEGVKWTGEQRPVEAGELKFDETGRRAEWRLNRMPTSVKSVTVSFDVELTPSPSDIGDILDLTGDIRFEALDKETQNVILKSANPIGTDLLGDQNAAGKGVVGE